MAPKRYLRQSRHSNSRDDCQQFTRQRSKCWQLKENEDFGQFGAQDEQYRSSSDESDVENEKNREEEWIEDYRRRLNEEEDDDDYDDDANENNIDTREDEDETVEGLRNNRIIE